MKHNFGLLMMPFQTETAADKSIKNEGKTGSELQRGQQESKKNLARRDKRQAMDHLAADEEDATGEENKGKCIKSPNACVASLKVVREDRSETTGENC